MAQPAIRGAVQKLSRASSSVLSAGQRLALTLSTSGQPSATLSPLAVRRIHFSPSQSQVSSGRNVVSLSSILLQDGLQMEELPILVRLVDKSMVPLSNHSFPGELIRPMTEEDANFQVLLQQCASVKDVFKLLEIPSERVTGYSATAALRRLCELQKMNRDWEDLHSFIRTAVMNELNSTVRKDLGQLSNEAVLSLVSCYMDMESFSHECQAAINGEIEKRLVDGHFSILELCLLSDLLHTSDRGDRDLIHSVWVHIGNCYQDIDEGTMGVVLATLPPSYKYLLKVLGRQVRRMWWKMRGEQVVDCLNGLVRLGSLQVSMMSDFSHWLFLNVHSITDQQLMSFLAAYVHFHFSDPKVTTAVERYVTAGGDDLHTDLLALVMEYCRSRRYFSPLIMDAAARHFLQHGHTYSALQMFSVLRPFGQLNYLPKDSHQFLIQTEQMLSQRFSEFAPAQLAELLCSFAFVEKIPLNFVQKVLTPTFLSRLRGTENSKEAGLWLEMLQSAVKLETRGVRIPYLYKKQAGAIWRDERTWMLQSRLEETLQKMFDSSLFRSRTYASNTVYTIDAEMHISRDRRPVPVMHQASVSAPLALTKLALLIMAVDHYCVNSGHLLGEYAMRRRHLHRLGYTVVEVYDAEFLKMNTSQRTDYIAQKLQKWIDISAMNISS